MILWLRIITAGVLAGIVFVANLVIVPMVALALLIAPKDSHD